MTAAELRTALSEYQRVDMCDQKNGRVMDAVDRLNTKTDDLTSEVALVRELIAAEKEARAEAQALTVRDQLAQKRRSNATLLGIIIAVALMIARLVLSKGG